LFTVTVVGFVVPADPAVASESLDPVVPLVVPEVLDPVNGVVVGFFDYHNYQAVATA